MVVPCRYIIVGDHFGRWSPTLGGHRGSWLTLREVPSLKVWSPDGGLGRWAPFVSRGTQYALALLATSRGGEGSLSASVVRDLIEAGGARSDAPPSGFLVLWHTWQPGPKPLSASDLARDGLQGIAPIIVHPYRGGGDRVPYGRNGIICTTAGDNRTLNDSALSGERNDWSRVWNSCFVEPVHRNSMSCLRATEMRLQAAGFLDAQAWVQVRTAALSVGMPPGFEDDGASWEGLLRALSDLSKGQTARISVAGSGLKRLVSLLG